MINLDNLSKQDLKAVGQNVRNLRRLDKELGIKVTPKQKAIRWRSLVQVQEEYVQFQKDHADQLEEEA